MSLKSFDKFCENIIMGEPASQKAVFDERQNQLRRQYTIEALWIFAGSSFLNTMIMECGAQWSESYAAPMMLLAALSFLYWFVRNAVKGTLFGVNGTAAVTYTGWFCMAMGVLYSVKNFPFSEEDWDTFVISGGMVSEDLLIMIALALYFASGLVIVIAAHRFKKAEKMSKED
ncbi:MAG: hypothetical protein ACI4XA_06275 [Oscillospiraceae bacterium]